MKQLKKILLTVMVIGVSIFFSCKSSEQVDGVYSGDLTHGGNPKTSATVSLAENGNNFVYVAVNSSFGTFIKTNVKVNPEASYFNLLIEVAIDASTPNEMIDVLGYCDPQNKKIHFSYTLDVDGVPGGTTIEGSFDGTSM